MISRKIISEVKRELNSINFSYDEVFILNISDNVAILNIEYNQESYIVNYYEDGCVNVVERYCEFTKNGINMLKILAHTDKIVVYPDFYCGNEYRRLKMEDLEDGSIISSIAKIYKNVFEFNGILAKDYCYDFSKESLRYIMDRFDWSNNDGLCYIYSNFDNIKLKLDRLKKGLIIKKFNIDNFVVSLENKGVFACGVLNVEKAYLYKGLHELSKIIDVSMLDVFDDVLDVEKVIDFVVSCVVEIYLYVTKQSEIGNINEYIDRVVSGELYRKSKILVEWY